MIQIAFLVSIQKSGVKRKKYTKVCDKVSVANINPQIVTTMCNSVDSVSTLTAAGMLKLS